MASFADVCRFTAASSGTGAFVVSTAVTGYQTPANAQVVDGQVYKYRAESANLLEWEVGYGVYTASGTSLARTTILFNSSGGTSAINFTLAPQVALVAYAEDLNPVDGAIFGLTLSTAGSSATFSVATGWCADSTAVNIMRLYSAYSKTTSSWAVGSGNGALDTGSIANSTWYHVYVIKRLDTGVTDVLVSTSATSPTMPTNYTLKRRIGSMKTDGSAQWTKFIQNGDTFMWDAPVNDITATNPGTSAVTRNMSTPLGVIVQGIFAVDGFGNSSTSNPGSILLSDLAQSDIAPGDTLGFSIQTFSSASASLEFGATAYVYTNTSSQIRSRIQQSVVGVTILIINTMGWVDTRGRLA